MLFDSGTPAAFNVNDKIIHLNYIGHMAAHFHKTINPEKFDYYFPEFQCTPNIFDDKSIYFEISVISGGNQILFQMFPRDFIKPTGSNNTCTIRITNIYFDDYYTNNVIVGAPFFKKYFVGYNYEANKLILGKTNDGEKICPN